MAVSRRYIKECLDEVWAEAREHYSDLPKYPPTLKVTRSVGQAGSCKYKHDHKAPSGMSARCITITKHHKTKLATYSTVRHEVAHAVATYFHGRVGHGPKWKAIDIKLDGDGERCHNGAGKTIDERAHKKKHKYAVVCKDCGWERPYQRRGKVYKRVSRANHNNGYHGYGCPKCKSKNLDAGPRSIVSKS